MFHKILELHFWFYIFQFIVYDAAILHFSKYSSFVDHRNTYQKLIITNMNEKPD